EDVGDVEILGLHLEAAGLGRDVVNVNVAAIPAAARNGRPARDRDGEHAIAHGRGAQLSAGDTVLVPFEDLVLHRQPSRVKTELTVNIGVAARLEADVALLRIVGKIARMTERNQLIPSSIEQADPGWKRHARFGVDDPADDGLPGAASLSRGRDYS